MKKSVVLFSMFLTNILFAQDSISVLFIGNSYVYVNDLPSVFSNLTTSLGDEATIDSKTNGGFTFQNQLSDPLTHTKIESRLWDYVVLQGQSQEPSFPTDQVNTSTLPPAVSLADSVYSNWYCSQAVYFMTWGRQNGDSQWDSINTFDKMNNRLRNAYVRIADSAQASISPVGVAWKIVRDNYPLINLYAGDGSHPSVEGTYLSACTFYAALFRKSPVGATFTFGLDPTTAGILQNAAALAVLDSLDIFHLRPQEEISIADFQFEIVGNSVQFVNTSWRSTDFNWSFGDGGVSTNTNPLYTFSANGNYTVQLVASSQCGEDTISYQVVIDALSLEESNKEKIKVRNNGNGQYELFGITNSEISSVVLLDATGKILKSNVIENNVENKPSIVIDIHNFPNGIYFLKFYTEHGVQVIDLPKFE